MTAYNGLSDADDRALREFDRQRLHQAGEIPDWALPVDQAQEHADHEAGCATEHQNAFALSQMRHDSGWGAVQALIDVGRFVLVYDHPAYCRSTDAVIGTSYYVSGDYATREEADAVCARCIDADQLAGNFGEGGWDVYPKAPFQHRTDAECADDDIPF